jgi:hypothetical protein
LNSGVYQIVNRVSGKRYIGSATNLMSRFAVHRSMLSRGRHHSRHLQNAWAKYGQASFEFHPVLICKPCDLLFYEQRALDVLQPEYNLSPSARNALGVRWSDEARQRHSALQQSRPTRLGKKHTPEARRRISLAKMGNTATKGKPRNAAAVAATAAAHRGMKRSPETRAKIAAKARGRKWTDEAKAKLSATLTGRKLSEQHRQTLIGNKRAAKRKESQQ